MDIRAILLAAGSGSRFGGGKLLAPLADGVPVGTASWKNLSAAIEETLVVVRSTDTEVALGTAVVEQPLKRKAARRRWRGVDCRC